MPTVDEIKKHLVDLLKEEQPLVALANGEDTEILKFGSDYQVWYTKAVKLVELLGPDRLAEFVSYYKTDPKRKALTADTYSIQDFIRGIGPAPDAYGKVRFDIHQMAAILLTNQFQLLAALDSRIDSVLADVTGHLFAELQDSELQTALPLRR